MSLEIIWQIHGRPQDFFPGVGKLGAWRRKSHSGVQGWNSGGGLGAMPPEADEKL